MTDDKRAFTEDVLKEVWEQGMRAQAEPYVLAERQRNEAEIERLRDALKRIAGGWPKPMQLARETLEKKK